MDPVTAMTPCLPFSKPLHPELLSAQSLHRPGPQSRQVVSTITMVDSRLHVAEYMGYYAQPMHESASGGSTCCSHLDMHTKVIFWQDPVQASAASRLGHHPDLLLSTCLACYAVQAAAGYSQSSNRWQPRRRAAGRIHGIVRRH